MDPTDRTGGPRNPDAQGPLRTYLARICAGRGRRRSLIAEVCVAALFMSQPGRTPVVRPVIAPMRWLLYAASTLVFLAGLQLTVFTEQTDTYFAWTITPPLTAAFLGAAYWAAVPVEVIAARQTIWAKARVAVPAIWLFTTLTLVATLLHFGKFHFSSAIASAQGAAWFWLAIYAGVPVVMLLIGWLQIHAPGSDPPRGYTAAIWMRAIVLGQEAEMSESCVGLFVHPAVVCPVSTCAS